MLYKPPGGTRIRSLEGAKPVLHSWNNFKLEPKRKPPLARHTSPRKKKKKTENVEENLTDSGSDDVFIELGDIIYKECDISEAQLIDNYFGERNKFT